SELPAGRRPRGQPSAPRAQLSTGRARQTTRFSRRTDVRQLDAGRHLRARIGASGRPAGANPGVLGIVLRGPPGRCRVHLDFPLPPEPVISRAISPPISPEPAMAAALS